MAPPLPNSAHTETSSYLRNLAVPRGLNLSARNRSKEPFVVFPASRIGSRMPERASYCVLATAESDPADWIVTCWLRASCQRPSRSTQTRMLL